jgi:hypothetical protein
VLADAPLGLSISQAYPNSYDLAREAVGWNPMFGGVPFGSMRE